MKYLLWLLLLIPSMAFGQQSVQGTPNGYPVAVSGTVTSTLCTSATCSETVVGQGTAGTPSGGVVSIQGVGGGTTLPVTAAQGTPLSTAGWPVYPQVCSGSTCYVTPVNAGAVVITSGSTSVIFASTTSIDPGSFCNNSTASAVTLTATDGNNVPFTGTTTFGASFSIPALSKLSFNDIAGSIFTSGIRMSASAASAITCWIRGHQ